MKNCFKISSLSSISIILHSLPYNLLQIYLIEKISDIYPANSLNTNSYRQKLIDDCSYFIIKDVPVRQVEIEINLCSFENVLGTSAGGISFNI